MAQKSRYFKTGLTVFLTTAAILLFYDTLFGSGTLLRIGKQLISAARPVLYGAFMAYLLAPMVNYFERRPFAASNHAPPPKTTRHGAAITRAVSIFLAWAIIGIMLYLLGMVLLPELYKSLMQLVSNIENYYYTVAGWIQHLFENNPVHGSYAFAFPKPIFTPLVHHFVPQGSLDVFSQLALILNKLSVVLFRWCIISFIVHVLSVGDGRFPLGYIHPFPRCVPDDNTCRGACAGQFRKGS